MDKQTNHDKFHDESKTRTHRMSKLHDDGDPWAPNNLLTPVKRKTPVEPMWTNRFLKKASSDSDPTGIKREKSNYML